MTETKHTPGPWTVGLPPINDFGASLAIMAQGKAGGVYVAEVWKVDDDSARMTNDVEGNANAHLIAAAPDYDDAARWAEKILTAYLEADTAEEQNYYYKDLEHARDRLRAAIDKAKKK